MDNRNRIMITLCFAIVIFLSALLYTTNHTEIDKLKVEVTRLKQKVLKIEIVVEHHKDWIQYFYNEEEETS